MTAEKPRYILRQPFVAGVHLVDKGDNPTATIVMFKRRATPTSKSMKTPEEIMAGLPEEDRKTMEQAMAQMAANKPAAPAPVPAAKTEDATAAAAAPALPGDVQKKLDEFDKLTKRVRELEDTQNLDLFRKRAREEFAAIPGANLEEKAQLLKACKENLGATEFEKLCAMLKSAAAVLSKSAAFTELGTAASDGNGVDAKSQVDAIAKTLKEKNPEWSMAKARTVVYDQHPELRDAVRGREVK